MQRGRQVDRQTNNKLILQEFNFFYVRNPKKINQLLPTFCLVQVYVLKVPKEQQNLKFAVFGLSHYISYSS